MSDPLRGKYTEKRLFRHDFMAAKERLAPLGGKVVAGTNDYEAFIYEGPKLRLIFYPHKTSAGNYHIRVRPSGKFDMDTLRAALFALEENTCTFQCPTHPKLHDEAVHAAIEAERQRRKKP